MQPEAEPKSDWVRHAIRVSEVIDNQVRSVRKRQIVGSFELGYRTGAYWGIRTNISEYGPSGDTTLPFDKTMAPANLATRLKRLDGATQDRLINWGYAVCDAALRCFFDRNLPRPGDFPYPGGVG